VTTQNGKVYTVPPSPTVCHFLKYILSITNCYNINHISNTNCLRIILMLMILSS